MESLFQTPTRRQGSPAAHNPSLYHTPTADRFISHHSSQDERSLSHFLLTSENPAVTPLLLSKSPQRSQMVRGGTAGGGLLLGRSPSYSSAIGHGGSRDGHGGFNVSPSPSRSQVVYGSMASSQAFHNSSFFSQDQEASSVAASLGIPAAPPSLHATPDRFTSEVGTDAGMEEDHVMMSRMTPSSGRLLYGGNSGERSGRSAGGGAGDSSGVRPGLGSAASTPLHHVMVNVEPYSARLARSLFSDTTQTSVLCHHDHVNSSSTAGSPSSPFSMDQQQHQYSPSFSATSYRTAGSQSRGGDGGTRGGMPLGSGAEDDSLLNEEEDHSPANGGGGGSADVSMLSEEEHYDQLPAVVFQRNKARSFLSSTYRHISSTPERILDAANLVDEYYYNVLDCSINNVVAVALQSSLYMWDWETENITTLPREEENVSGVKWCGDGVRLASSTERGDVVVWDTTTGKDVGIFAAHDQRVCGLAWGASGCLLASGSKDATVVLNDTRSRIAAHTLKGHTSEVCGLQWSLGDMFLASGGDDNQLLVWDTRRLDVPMHSFAHKSAVKGIAWNPVQPYLLVSGGGIEDQSLRFWSVDTGECVRAVPTGSQVCGIVWNHAGTELCSCHGYPNNQLTLWKYPSLNRIVELTGHRSRVLHLCLSADGQTVISAASDETVRFWMCFHSSDA